MQWVHYDFKASGHGGQGCETCMDWTKNYGTELCQPPHKPPPLWSRSLLPTLIESEWSAWFCPADNLTADPGEGRNIAGTAEATAGGLQERLSAKLRAGWRAL